MLKMPLFRDRISVANGSMKMIEPIAKNYKGLTSITGPTRSGKSQLAEFLLSEQDPVTYIATSKPRPNDSDWQDRIDIHRERRPDSWTLIEHPKDICNVIDSIKGNHSILIDSLGGLVAHHLIEEDDQWNKESEELPIRGRRDRDFQRSSNRGRSDRLQGI